MRPRHLIGIVLGLTLLVVGCQAEHHLRKADAADAAGKSELAVRHYRLALKSNPRLRADAELAARLQRVEALDLCDKADTLAQQGAWKTAIEKYKHALEIDPRCDRAHSRPRPRQWLHCLSPRPMTTVVPGMQGRWESSLQPLFRERSWLG